MPLKLPLPVDNRELHPPDVRDFLAQPLPRILGHVRAELHPQQRLAAHQPRPVPDFLTVGV